jgi:hypothetical protein
MTEERILKIKKLADVDMDVVIDEFGNGVPYKTTIFINKIAIDSFEHCMLDSRKFYVNGFMAGVEWERRQGKEKEVKI